MLFRSIAYHRFNGMLHRDLKPANVLLAEHWVAKVDDFGSSFRLSANGADAAGGLDGGIHGTPAYMAPEVISKKYSNKADIFSAAIMFGELFSGRRADMSADDPVGELLDAAAPRDAPTEAMYVLTRFMLHAKSSERPTAEAALAKLDELCCHSCRSWWWSG